MVTRGQSSAIELSKVIYMTRGRIMQKDLWREIVTGYEQCLNQCTPQAANDSSVTELLDMSRRYLAIVSISDNSQGTGVIVTRTRVGFYEGAKTILARAPWLDNVTRQALQAFINEQGEFFSSNYMFTAAWFERHAEQWKNNLKRMIGAPGLRFLEVGSFEGFSTCWLLENILTHETSKITCIDSFDFGGQGIFENIEGFGSIPIESRFDQNIKISGSQHKVEKIADLSQNALRSLPLSHYDFIYVDGAHMALNVLEDAVLSWRLLRVDGLMTFDDYEWIGSSNPLMSPRIAIDAFLRIYAGHFKLVHKGYQVTIEKLS